MPAALSQQKGLIPMEKMETEQMQSKKSMRIKFLNTEYFIGSCNNEDIPEWITKLGPAKDVAFFYYHDRDWIVLNEDNVNYEFYKVIVENYLSFTDEIRKDFMIHAFEISKSVYRSLRCLNYILRIRRKLYRSMKRKAGVVR